MTSSSNNEQRIRILAIGITLLVALLLSVSMVVLKLTYPPEEKPIWEVDEGEILLADEYITMDQILPTVDQLGEEAIGEPVEGEDAAPAEAPGTDIVDAGEPAPAAPVVTQEKPSKVQAVKQPEPKKTATPKPNKEEQEKAAAASKINSSVGNAFASTNANSQGTKPGAENNPQGGTTTKSANGTSPGVTWQSGGGWSVKNRPQLDEQFRTKRGSVTIEITVDASGKVIKAEQVNGTGAAGADQKVIQACIALAKKYTFARTGEAQAPSNSVGRITWVI